MVIESEIRQSNNLPYLIAAYILILLGYSFNKGIYFHPFQLGFLLLGWLMLFLPFVKKDWIEFKFSLAPEQMLLAANLISFLLFFIFDGGIYLVTPQGYNNLLTLKFIALLIFLLYFVDFKFLGDNFFSALLLHLQRNKFKYLVALAVMLRLAVIFYSPRPLIDTYFVLEGGSESLFHFANPYAASFTNVYSPQECQVLYGEQSCQNDMYTYFPAAILLTAPFKLIFGDVRLTFVFCQLAIAAMIYFLLREKFRQKILICQLLTLLSLYLPLSLFVLEQSWVDPLLIFLLYAFILASLLNFKYLPFIIFGVALAVKQLAFVFLLFLLKLKGLKIKTALAFFIFCLITAPFLMWGANDFLHDAVWHHLQYKAAMHSLSLSTLIKAGFFADFPRTLNIIFLLFLLFLFIKAGRSLADMIYAGTIFLFFLFIFKQGFANYYYSICLLILLLVTLSLNDNLPASKDYDHG